MYMLTQIPTGHHFNQATGYPCPRVRRTPPTAAIPSFDTVVSPLTGTVRYSTPTPSGNSFFRRGGQQSETSLRRKRTPSDIAVRCTCISTDRYNDTTGTEAIPAEELSVERRSLFTLELEELLLRYPVSNPTGASSWRRDKNNTSKNI